MPNERAHRLRELCVGYPRTAIVDAVDVALGDSVPDSNERQALASLLATWLSDEEGTEDPPPMDAAFVENVGHALRARAH